MVCSRGIKLVEDDNARRDATRDYARRRWDSTRQILADQDVFVNEDTLELGIDRIIQSRPSANVPRTHWLQGKGSKLCGTHGGATLKTEREILARIERIGKGRFAQRLAPKVEGKRPPAYIKSALDKIIKLTTR